MDPNLGVGVGWTYIRSRIFAYQSVSPTEQLLVTRGKKVTVQCSNQTTL